MLGLVQSFGRFLVILTLIAQMTHFAAALCEKDCNDNGYCDARDICRCFKDIDNHVLFTGNDCSLKTCPRGPAWSGIVTGMNDVHPLVECSNQGECDRASGTCTCYNNRVGLACERAPCPHDCTGNGVCLTQKALAARAGRIYETPWDADMQVGCLCDTGFSGPDCSSRTCPSGPDVMKGPGANEGRVCSGRGFCSPLAGLCQCYPGYGGNRCQFQLANTV
jgi:hypothetical protein